MKKAILLLIGWCIIGHASSAAQDMNNVLSLYEQKAGVQKFIPLKESLRILEDKYNVTFIYKNYLVEDKKVLRKTTSAESFQTAFTQILTSSDLTYEQIGSRSFLLLPTEDLSQLAALETVQGVVTDASTGETLPGVNIAIKGTTTGASTDSRGHFELNVPSLSDTLVFSFIGYQTLELPIQGRTDLNVVLQPMVISGEEVVVVGYGTQEKKAITGSTVEVESEDITNTNSLRAEQALQGQTPGVQVSSTSGQPGAGLKVRIRGTGTIGDAEPLYVVDGVPTDDISYLSPSIIERIDILKDAASAAIYGARASNGVVLITTKQGDEGSVQLSIDSYYGVQNFYKTLPMLNAKEYAVIMNEANINSGQAPVFDLDEINNMNQGTDWLNEAMNRDAPVQNHSLTLSGGNSTSRYTSSLSYFQQEGIIGGDIDKSNFERITFTINSDHKVLDDMFTLGENLTYSRVNSRGLRVAGLYNNSLRGFFNASPNYPVYNGDGEFAQSVMDPSNETNPIGALSYQDFNRNSTDKLLGNAFVELQPIKGVSLRSDLGMDLSLDTRNSFDPVYRLNDVSYNEISSASQGSTRETMWNWDNTLEYIGDFQDHRIEVLVGMTAQELTSTWMDATKEGLIFDDFDHAFLNNGTSDSTIVATGSRYKYALYSQFGRVNYNFDEKYLLSATIRRDGSSNFGPSNRYGIFPSVSAGWVLTEESPLSDIPVLDFLKVRASWGQNGNDRIQEFAYMSTLESNYREYYFGSGDAKYVGTSPDKVANPNLKWEASEQINAGLDATFFSNLDLTVDWYKKRTKDWLLVAPIPDLVGTNAPTINGGTIENRGVEVALGYRKTIRDFFFSVNANAAFNRNEVVAINNDEKIIHGDPNEIWQGISEVNRAEVGQPVGYFWGHQVAGIFQNEEEIQNYRNNEQVIQPDAVPGDVKFVDLNSDGQITDADKTDIGDPNPDLTYGLNINVGYKGFDASIYTYGMAGHQNIFSVRSHERWYHNYTTDILNRWHGEGTSNTVPRVTRGDESNGNYKKFSELYIQDADFLRIKTVSLGYDFSTLIEDLPVRKFRVYLSANNLFTFTKYKGMDPEVGFGPSTDPASGVSYNMSQGFDVGYYPQPRTFQVGVNIQF